MKTEILNKLQSMYLIAESKAYPKQYRIDENRNSEHAFFLYVWRGEGGYVRMHFFENLKIQSGILASHDGSMRFSAFLIARNQLTALNDDIDYGGVLIWKLLMIDPTQVDCEYFWMREQ